MKPPGGDSHDIFGADFHGTPSHHRVLKPPGGGTSSLFSSSTEETDKPGATSASVNSIQTNASVVTEGKTNGVIGKNGNVDVLEENTTKSDVMEKKSSEFDLNCSQTSVLSAEIKNLTLQEEKRVKDGNPVTGEGYDTPENQTPAPQRTRIPPGGYSSGLW